MRSPIYSILKLLALCLLVFFIAMHYWSSLLIEEDLKEIKNEIKALKKQVLSSPITFQKTPQVRSTEKTFFSPSNLLSEDLFYEKTLPKLLGEDFTPQGTIRQETIGRPPNLHPFSAWYELNKWLSLCVPSLADQKVGIYDTYSPSAATSIELKNGSEYLVKMREDLYWEPLDQQAFPNIKLDAHFLKRHPVTARDVKFFYDAFMNPHVEGDGAVSYRAIFADIEEVEVIDDYTLVIRWKTKEIDGQKKIRYTAKMLTAGFKPLPSFVYQYFADGTKIVEEDGDKETYRKDPVWAQNFSHHWALQIIPSCGPWIFQGLTDQEIRFKRNPNYYDPLAALAKESVTVFRDSTDSVWNDFKIGKVDSISLPPHQIEELETFLASSPYQEQKKKGGAIETLQFFMRRYAYIGWNEKKPFFNSKKVRKALTMAIDRQRIIRQNLNGMGIETTGTFSPFSPSYDKSIQPLAFDPLLAKRLLNEEGWIDKDGDGILDKEINGVRVPFRFDLLYFAKNPLAKTIIEYIAVALKEVGIDCKPKGVDIADLSAIFDERNFDAYYLEWVLGTPPENPRQLWHSEGADKRGSSNAIGFSNKEADAIIDTLDYEEDEQKRIALYHRFDAILYDEQPYTFLYVPKINFIYRERLQNVWIPAERQDLIPGANVEEPEERLFWVKE